MGLLGFLASLFSGFASFLLNILSSLLVIAGTFLILSGNPLLGAILFALGCIALAIAELFDLYVFYGALSSNPVNFWRAFFDFALFALGSLALPALLFAIYFLAFRSDPLLIIALAAAAIAGIKIFFRLVRLLIIPLKR